MDSNRTEKIPHRKPNPINTAATYQRHRSGSLSSDSSDGSPSDPIQTPLNVNSPRVTTVSPSSSFFSHILGQQSATAKTFPFRRGTADSIGSTGPVFDDGLSSVRKSNYLHTNAEIDDTQEPDPASLHKVHRRATTSWTSGSPPLNPLAGDRQERASGLLRRLSLSTPFPQRPPPGFGNNDQPPAVPPNTALPNSPTNKTSPLNQGRNSPPRKPARRAPSPMGERILKGHFDGFN